jgi:hypothetical protein
MFNMPGGFGYPYFPIYPMGLNNHIDDLYNTSLGLRGPGAYNT